MQTTVQTKQANPCYLISTSRTLGLPIFLGFSATLGMFVGVKKMSTEVWCIRESHVYSMLTKRKTTSLGYAEPNEEKRIRSGKFHQPDTRIWSKERKKEPRKENPPKGERIDLLTFRRRAHSRPTHSSLSLSLSPSFV